MYTQCAVLVVEVHCAFLSTVLRTCTCTYMYTVHVHVHTCIPALKLTVGLLGS